MKCYLAGPFFNKESKAIVQMLMDKLESFGHEVWAPMRDGITCSKDADREMRQKVFNLDREQLHWADCIVALLDYPLPPYERLLLRTRDPEGKIDLIDVSFPDSGTVLEIGYVNGLNEAGKDPYRYIIGWAMTSRFNLMVSEACDCIVSNIAQLERVMQFVEAKDGDALLLLKTQYGKGDLQEF